MLESHGYKVGFIAQPDWNDPESIAVFGEPRLGFLVSAGNMDSMVNHYTVNKKRRHDDAYTPGGKDGARPNHAAVVYSNLIRRTFKETPIILGGIEASLRRLAHYDYWSDSLKRSILLDSGADLISYGMGERSIVEIADALAAGLSVSDLTFIDGTVFRTRSLEHVVDYEMLPGWEEVSGDKRAFAESFAAQYRASDPVCGSRLVETYPHGVYVVQNPPAAPLTQNEMDAVYRLPYARTWHPSYDEAGGVPALSEVKFSLTSCRGCFGECAFCALTFHQGRIVTGRSHESLLDEARVMTADPEFKGYIHDVGGPTANFRGPACAKQRTRGACTDRRCLGTKPCPAMKADHRDYTGLLRKLRKLPGVKKVFVRSGIRFDYVMADPDPDRTFLRELVEHHVSGQLSVRSSAHDVVKEHAEPPTHRVLPAAMGKPPQAVMMQRRGACGPPLLCPAMRRPIIATTQVFCAGNQSRDGFLRELVEHQQFVVPYLMSSHPGHIRAALAEAIGSWPIRARHGLQPRAGAGFLPHALDDFHVHVLHGPRSPDYGTHLRAEDPAREGPSAGAHPVPQPRQLRLGARGANEGRANRPHRLGQAVPHPPQAPQEEGSGGRRCPAQGEGEVCEGRTCQGRTCQGRTFQPSRPCFGSARRQAAQGQRSQRRHPQRSLSRLFP